MKKITATKGVFSLLKPAVDKCQVCAVDHEPDQPHDQTSLYYHITFFNTQGRYPTWADAVAHCDVATRTAWKKELTKRNKWTE